MAGKKQRFSPGTLLKSGPTLSKSYEQYPCREDESLFVLVLAFNGDRENNNWAWYDVLAGEDLTTYSADGLENSYEKAL